MDKLILFPVILLVSFSISCTTKLLYFLQKLQIRVKNVILNVHWTFSWTTEIANANHI